MVKKKVKHDYDINWTFELKHFSENESEMIYDDSDNDGYSSGKEMINDDVPFFFSSSGNSNNIHSLDISKECKIKFNNKNTSNIQYISYIEEENYIND